MLLWFAGGAALIVWVVFKDPSIDYRLVMLGAVLPDLAIGDRVRILPNHACATGAQHRSYHVVRGSSENVEAEWPRFGGWQ